MIGAILAGASEKDVEAIGTAASKFGLAFQIRDDILDISGSEEELGKPIGSDAKNHKVTMATLLGEEAAEKEVERLSEEAIAILQSYTGDDDFLPRLVRYLIRRTR